MIGYPKLINKKRLTLYDIDIFWRLQLDRPTWAVYGLVRSFITTFSP